MIDRQDYLQCEWAKGEFSHAGDLGDIIWGTAAIRLWCERNGIEKAKLYLYDQPGKTTHFMSPERAANIATLLNMQPWLEVYHSPRPVRSDIDGFRDHMRSAATIAGAHLAAIGMGKGGHSVAVERRWLELPSYLTGEAKLAGRRVVFVRTHRYKSHDFPWNEIVDWFGNMAVFLGLANEWESFCNDHPKALETVRYVPTETLLEAALIINTADFVVSNQTALFAVAEALKKPRVLESYVPIRNCEYGSRNCLALHPGMTVTPQRIVELMSAPYTV